MTSATTDELLNVTVTSQPAIQFVETRIVMALMLYVLPVIIAVGTVGNVTSFIVLLRSRMYQSSVYLFLLLLAVADTLVLYVSGFKTWIRVLVDFELLNVSDVTCKLVTFLFIVSQHLAAWIVVLVTVDRFVAVWFPLRATYWCTVSRAWIATLVTTVVIALYAAHVFWTHELRRTGRPRCQPAKVGEHVPDFFMSGHFNRMILLTYCIVPFAVILSLNVAIIVRLRWTSPALKTSQSPRAAGPGMNVHSESDSHNPAATASAAAQTPRTNVSSRATQQARVTYMLLTVSTTWILLTAPFGFYSLVVPWPSADKRQREVEHLVKTICFLLMYSNHAVNFFLYCVTGRKFRRELFDLLARLCLCHGASLLLRGSPSVKTQRSNCLELNPLNESTRAAPGYSTLRRHYVTDSNDVTAGGPRDSVHDVTLHDSSGKQLLGNKL